MAITKTTPPQWSGVHRLPGLEGRIPPARRDAIVLSTLGSLGDLYPILSVARALEAMGTEVRLALSPDDCEIARGWGLLATPVGPSEAEVTERTGLSRDDIADQVLRDMGRNIVPRVALPILPEILREMEPICQHAALVSGTLLALAAPIMAERHGVPFVPLALQPMLTLSPQAPPRAHGFQAMVPAPEGPLALAWNRLRIALAHRVFRLRHGKDMDAIRAQIGLPPSPVTPILEAPGQVAGTLGLWSRSFAPLPPDREEAWTLTGFPPSPEGLLPPEVQTWLEAGPPPLVVTLGSIGHRLAGETFWQEAVALARRMDLRVVLLHGAAEVPDGPDILALRYGAHGPLFPQAAAILHHGGIGTTAEALRAGRPQIVVPIGGDQMDNARHLERLGVAVTLPPRRFRADRAATALQSLLDRIDYPKMAALADRVCAEDGAKVAAMHLRRLAGL